MLVRTVDEVGRTQRLRASDAVNERELDLAIAGKGETEGELMAAQAQLGCATRRAPPS